MGQGQLRIGILLLTLGAASPASAANILFVSDNGADNGIATTLTAAGHTVTMVNGDYMGGANPTLNASLSAYDAVFWSANGSGFGSTHTAATMAALTTYVSAGGFVFVTGYDSVASPTDGQLIAFLGGGGSRDVPGSPGAMIDEVNALTVGEVDLRGTTPSGGPSDRDALNALAADTVGVVFTGTSTTEAQWTLRTVGSGLIAYVSNGNSGTGNHSSWTTVSSAYNGAVRNFASWSDGARILLVSDNGADLNIETALLADGHDVTVVSPDFSSGANPTLVGDLSAYDVVYWSANGSGFGSTHSAATFTALSSYLTAGGRVFVTGYDSVASPGDPALVAFLGAGGSRDLPNAPGSVTSPASELSVGVVDIVGVTPTGGSSDRDALSGLMGTTQAVVFSGGSSTEAQWTVRAAGAGRAAYVSNGNSGTGAHSSWTNSAAGSTGAYNAAVRNFAYWAVAGVSPTPGGANGAVCAVGTECGSGSCVDGVCCDAACGGTNTSDCQACAVAAGAAVDGICAPLAAATACRASTGGCDTAEVCNGASTACPADGFAGAGTTCRASAGACDAAETCTGTSRACPANGFAAAGTTCRASVGSCDATESCTGAAAACPADALQAAGAVCRAAAGPCDTAEACTGVSTACPANALVAAGITCRGVADRCDAPEACTGASVACPANLAVPAGMVCRTAAGACDVSEMCNGTSLACPGNTFMATGTQCRAATGACDAAEACTGGAAACPTDVAAADGLACDDGLACNAGETCTAGVCGAGGAEDCDDGDVCTADSCAEPGGCANEAVADCCARDVDCDDGDSCTTDSCGGDNTCTNTAIAGCIPTDGGMTDGGGPDGAVDDGGVTEGGLPADSATGDSGVGADSGLRRRDSGGCGCAVPNGTDGPTGGGFLALLVVGSFLVRRRRRR